MTTYVVFTRESTIDPAELKIYGEKAGPAGQGHPITRLAFYGDVETLEGSPVEGAVILSFLQRPMHWPGTTARLIAKHASTASRAPTIGSS